MAFSENISVPTMQSVVDEMSAFAVANAGFTALPDVSIAGKTTTMKILLKDSMYYYFYGETVSGVALPLARIMARMMRVEPTALNYANFSGTLDAQLYPSRMSIWNNLNGPYEGLNLYTDGNAIHVVVEVSINVFAHMSFGIVEKFLPWTGGEYITANYIVRTSFGSYIFTNNQNLYIFDGGYSTAPVSTLGMNSIRRILPSGASNNSEDYPVIGLATSGPSTQIARSSGYSGNAQLHRSLYLASPNALALRAMLMPIYILVSKEGSLIKHQLQGRIPSAKFLNIRNLNPKDIVDVNWIVYPYVTKIGDVTEIPVSGDAGLAYYRA